MTEIINILVQVVNGVGFPIACTIILFWMLYRQQEQHKAEAEGWTAAINNNTAAISALTSHLEGAQSNDNGN